jgi:pimeloyl-ACP methyl ester carboxylesterase
LHKLLSCALVALALSNPAWPQALDTQGPGITTQPRLAPTLETLYAEYTVVDSALSPSGRYLALIVRSPADDQLMVVDLETSERTLAQRVAIDEAGSRSEMRMSAALWKSDERLLFRLQIAPKGEDYAVVGTKGVKLGQRLFSVKRDGSGVVQLLGRVRDTALEGAFDLGRLVALLPQDPHHVMMAVTGFSGTSLYRADVETGQGQQIEMPSESVVDWWLDRDGKPLVRVSSALGTVSFSRKVDGKWRKFHSMPAREMIKVADYGFVGASDQPAKYDLDSAEISNDGQRVTEYCFVAHVRICEFGDAQLGSHMKALRKYFDETANVRVYDSSADGRALLLFVDGPRDPPSFYYYRTDKKGILPIGLLRSSLAGVTFPQARVFGYRARDGQALSGYLTVPAQAPSNSRLPLVVLPHGGPESRDQLGFDPWVQFLAARGYAVFQPNFRGSDGFGRAFAESGYGQWGRKMQDDVTDGVAALVEQGVADPARMCIVGASYGGYAALAGAALTPDLYKCAVSIAGISDLGEFLDWRRKAWGKDSNGYTYWLRAIGDPTTDAQRLRDASPLQQVAKIKAPVLLIHGTDDDIVPIAQSRAMEKALDKAGHPTDLVELENQGHSFWTVGSEMRALAAIDAFLWKHLGPGVGVTVPPITPDEAKKRYQRGRGTILRIEESRYTAPDP